MTFVRTTVVPLIAGLFLSACASPEAPRPLSELSSTEMIQHLGLSGSDWGYHLVDIKTGKALASYQADITQPPASTAKLATMLASMSILGANYQFETSLMTDGVIVGDTLNGNLVLHGTGDPLLGANDLRDLAVKLSDQGVRRITGLFAYHSTLPTFAVVERNQPQTAPYNQGVSGLNVDFNRARLTTENTPSGAVRRYVTPVEATGLTPAIDMFQLRAVLDIPVNEPDVLAAQLLRKFAAFEGIALPLPVLHKDAVKLSPIATIKSLPLHKIARVGLEYSNNMVSEVVGLAAASTLHPRPESLSESSHSLNKWLDQNVIDDRRFAPFLPNHSGLSAAARITPQSMTDLLRHALKLRFDGQRFDQLLPPAGGREGYRGRFRNPEAAFRVWGKTGSMQYIKGLAGYIDANSGQRLAFAIFSNNLSLRDQLGHARNMDDESTRANASAWRDRTETFESEMIRRWISKH